MGIFSAGAGRCLGWFGGSARDCGGRSGAGGCCGGRELRQRLRRLGAGRSAGLRAPDAAAVALVRLRAVVRRLGDGALGRHSPRPRLLSGSRCRPLQTQELGRSGAWGAAGSRRGGPWALCLDLPHLHARAQAGLPQIAAPALIQGTSAIGRQRRLLLNKRNGRRRRGFLCDHSAALHRGGRLRHTRGPGGGARTMLARVGATRRSRRPAPIGPLPGAPRLQRPAPAGHPRRRPAGTAIMAPGAVRFR